MGKTEAWFARDTLEFLKFLHRLKSEEQGESNIVRKPKASNRVEKILKIFKLIVVNVVVTFFWREGVFLIVFRTEQKITEYVDPNDHICKQQ